MTFTIKNVASPVWANAERTVVNLSVEFNEIPGILPFSASALDTTEHGTLLFKNAILGTYGEVQPFVQPKKTPEQIETDIIMQTQARLDAWAKTRGYDSLLSACTYATSAVQKFASEGQLAVTKRDETWAALYAFVEQVKAGTQSMPTGYADVEPLLPVLEWPL